MQVQDRKHCLFSQAAKLLDEVDKIRVTVATITLDPICWNKSKYRSEGDLASQARTKDSLDSSILLTGNKAMRHLKYTWSMCEYHSSS